MLFLVGGRDAQKAGCIGMIEGDPYALYPFAIGKVPNRGNVANTLTPTSSVTPPTLSLFLDGEGVH